MSKLLIVIFMFLSSWAYGQGTEKILVEKIRHVTFELEKSLNSTLKERLAHEYPLEKLSVDVKLATDSTVLAKRLGISLKKSKFSLPGIDESSEMADNQIINITPTSSDVMSAVTQMNVRILSNKKLDASFESEVRNLITSEFSTLNINKINFRFIASKLAEEDSVKNESNSEIAPPKDPSFPINTLMIVIVSSGLLIAFVIGLSMYFGLKKMEKLSKDLSLGLSSMAMSSAASAPVNQQQNLRIPEPMNATQSQELEKYDELAKKIQSVISEKSDKLSALFDHVVDIHEPSKMMVIMEVCADKDKTGLLEKMPTFFKQEYEQFIAKFNTGSDMERTLQLAAKDILSDLKLLGHDPLYLQNKALKLKVQKLRRNDIPAFIGTSNEAEFSQLIQLIDPVMVASALAAEPRLIERFKYLSPKKLTSDELSAMSQKLDSFVNPDPSTKHTYNIASFLPPELEAEFNRKLGKKNTSWEMLSAKQLSDLEKFAKTLAIAQLSSLLAIMPDDIKAGIISRLPDIKSQQLQRFGIKLTDDSFRLKHEFFANNSSGTIQ